MRTFVEVICWVIIGTAVLMLAAKIHREKND